MEDKNAQEEKIQEKFREFYAKIQELETKAKELRVELDTKIDEQIGDMKENNTKLYTTFQELKLSSEAAFHDVKEGLNKAAEALHEAIKKATYHFKG